MTKHWFGLFSLVLLGALASANQALAQAKAPVAQAPPPAVSPVAKPPEAPPVSSVPQSTTAVFADWALQCRRSDAGAAFCEVNQTLQVQGQGTIAQIAIGRPPASEAASKEALRIVVVLPNNVTFGGPVQLSIDEKDKPVDLNFRRCLPAGCVADTEARDEFLNRWRAQAERGRLAFKDGSGRPIVLPFSFRGLAQALDAMAKTPG